LQEVLSAELASRHESVIRQRLREARFPDVKTLDTFDFPAADGVSATQIHALARGKWVTAPENLILPGPIGTGKTHLAIALGVEATKQNAECSSRGPPTSCASSSRRLTRAS
jgi:DNA replication protein DnaC